MIALRNLLGCTAVILCLGACSSKYYYVKGLKAARNPTQEKVFDQLAVVSTGDNKQVWQTIDGKQYVLAVTWKADTTYYTRKDAYNTSTGLYKYNTGNYPVFATIAPYLKEKGLGKLNDKKLTRRLDQLLGLPPTSQYSYFLEVWVQPEDLVRPCFDPSVAINVCEYFPSGKDNERTEYMSWLYKYIYDSYSDPDMLKRYPFTHLGYTFDWSPKNKSHVGLSEFVIGKNKNIYIRKVYTTRGYFEQQ